jgi:hypothetical protein
MTDDQRQTLETDQFEAGTDDSKSGLNVSRRAILGVLAVGGALGVAATRDELPVIGEDDKDSSTPNQPSGTGDSTGSFFDTERDMLDTSHQNLYSAMPSFEYDPIDEQLDESETQIQRVAAAPSDDRSGDHLVVVTDPGYEQQLVDLLVALWTDEDQHRVLTTMVDSQSVEFGLYAGEELAIGVATRNEDGDEPASQALITRGESATDVEQLVNNFDSFEM